MIIDEDAWQAFVAPHDHVLVTAPDDEYIWECVFCSFGLSSDEMPGYSAPDWRAEHERVMREADRRVREAAEAFGAAGRAADDSADAFRYAFRKTRGSGKRAAYEQAIIDATAQYGPGEPIVDRNGKVRGHQFFARRSPTVFDEATIIGPGRGAFNG